MIYFDIMGHMSELSESFTAYRGAKLRVGHDTFTGKLTNNLLRGRDANMLRPGDPLDIEAFASMSVDWHMVLGFGADASGSTVEVMMQVHIPQGVRAIVYNVNEQEILLPPGGKYIIRRVVKDANLQFLENYPDGTSRNRVVTVKYFLDVIYVPGPNG